MFQVANVPSCKLGTATNKQKEPFEQKEQKKP